jgi:hypothetical protein
LRKSYSNGINLQPNSAFAQTLFYCGSVHSQQETAQIQHRHKRANGHLAQGQFRGEYVSKAFHRLKDDTVDGGKHQ